MFNMFQEHNDNGPLLRLSSLLPVVWQETRKGQKTSPLKTLVRQATQEVWS